jgi:RHS repeat-associated protein
MTMTTKTARLHALWARLAALLALLLVVGVLAPYAGAQTTSVTFFHNDVLGSPAVATDASGAVVWKESYLPYGHRLQAPAAGANNKLWYAGKQLDPNTGLSYMGARYYSPVVGRFMGIDPVEFKEDNIHSLNRYAYANNNPYKYIDRDGRYGELAVEVISLTVGYMSLRENMRTGNTGAAITDGLGMLADIAGAAIPGLPGFAGLGIKASREAAELGVKKVDVGSPTAGKPVDSSTRDRILARDQNPDGSWTCATCGQKTSNPSNVHTGHIKARSHGGDLSDANLRCEGAACNLSQGNRSAPSPGMTCAARGSCGAPYGRSD